jgi:3-isopropylmalate/(R)-2-methylmalate dehydratase large subunit
MGHTISEKILARYAGKTSVSPGEYIVVKDFIGPIGYSFTGVNFLQAFPGSVLAEGLPLARPQNIIVNGDHNTPPKSIADVELFNSVRKLAKELGVSKIYDREGIGHVVNVEKGDINPGTLFTHLDPQSANAGGIGAYFTNGGRFGSSILEAFAFGELTLRVPETIKIEVNGELPLYVMGRDIWLTVLSKIGPDCAHGMVLEFCGSTIEKLSVEQRMILCCNAAFAGADSAILQSDEVTQAWFKTNFNRDVETIRSDKDAEYAKVYSFEATTFVPMVTYPPQIFTSKPASELKGIKINQCIIGTCSGGTLDDLRMAASILDGKTVRDGVRFFISPVTQRVYAQAAREGLLTTLVEAGAKILSPTCDVCIGIQGSLAPGEAGLSQQTLNVPGRSGSPDADIYLAGAAVIAASAINGSITDPVKMLAE